jgi:hypothetical protein
LPPPGDYDYCASSSPPSGNRTIRRLTGDPPPDPQQIVDQIWLNGLTYRPSRTTVQDEAGEFRDVLEKLPEGCAREG